MINAKKKGNLWENKLANWLSGHGIKAWKDSASGGGSREKGDVGNNIDFTIESKACKNIELMKWWRQVDKSASIHKNRPALFIHQDGMGDNEWLVTIHCEDWLDLVLDSMPSNRIKMPVSAIYRAKRIKVDMLAHIRDLEDFI